MIEALDIAPNAEVAIDSEPEALLALDGLATIIRSRVKVLVKEDLKADLNGQLFIPGRHSEPYETITVVH